MKKKTSFSWSQNSIKGKITAERHMAKKAQIQWPYMLKKNAKITKCHDEQSYQTPHLKNSFWADLCSRLS